MSSSQQRDVLVLGAVGGEIYLPDAITDFTSSLSAESAVRVAYRGRAYAPASPDGEVVFRRILLTGYHRSNVALWVTPFVDGRALHELRTYVQRPAPLSGSYERFDFLIPLARFHPDFPDHPFGVRGSVIDVYVEAEDPVDTFHLETITFAHDPITLQRGRRPGEAEAE